MILFELFNVDIRNVWIKNNLNLKSHLFKIKKIWVFKYKIIYYFSCFCKLQNSNTWKKLWYTIFDFLKPKPLFQQHMSNLVLNGQA